VEKWKNNFRVIYNTLRVALIFPPTTVFGFYYFSVVRKNRIQWKNNFRVIYNTLTLRVALVFLPTKVFGFYFPNTVTWKNGKLLSWWSYFFPRASFFSVGKFFYCRQVFSANNSIRFFSIVQKMAENPVGFLPHPTKQRVGSTLFLRHQ
jgi:hypothetical protein